jgi:hypothetical protein
MSRVGITFAKIKVGAAYSKLRALTSASKINASAVLLTLLVLPYKKFLPTARPLLTQSRV